MELHEYIGKPSHQEILQRLKFWKSWSLNAYKDNHLRIHHTCPVCYSDTDTEWVRQEWSICYSCLAAFNLESVPTIAVSHVSNRSVKPLPTKPTSIEFDSLRDMLKGRI